MKSCIKCSIVGETMVGKTCLLKMFTHSEMMNVYSPTIYEKVKGKVIHGTKTHKVTFIDTAGQHDYENLRPFTYKKSNVVILCYSVIDRQSFERIETDLMPEIKKNIGKKVHVILVATQTDRKSEQIVKQYVNVVTKEEGRQLADRIGAKGFFETSVMDHGEVNAVFECAVSTVINNRKTILSFLKQIFRIRRK